MTTDARTFTDAKVGDEVIIWTRSGFSRHTGRVRAIERVLAKHLVVEGSKYRKAGGSRAGDADLYGGSWITMATPEERATLAECMDAENHRSRLNYLRHAAWDKLPADLVKKIYGRVKDALVDNGGAP